MGVCDFAVTKQGMIGDNPPIKSDKNRGLEFWAIPAIPAMPALPAMPAMGVKDKLPEPKRVQQAPVLEIHQPTWTSGSNTKKNGDLI